MHDEALGPNGDLLTAYGVPRAAIDDLLGANHVARTADRDVLTRNRPVLATFTTCSRR